jgi:two-component system OmpR family response regulator
LGAVVHVGEARHPRVLVVNDDAPLAESVCQLLREEDYEARLALDGEAALRTFAEWPADVVVLDLIMPRLDGWRFLERRSHEASLAQVPVLVWSVGARDELELARRLGADVCLARTATSPDQLLDTIAKLLTGVDPPG